MEATETLVLTGKKRTPRQADFCYANSSINQERSFIQFEDWNVASIHRRRTEITECALKRWDIDLTEFR